MRKRKMIIKNPLEKLFLAIDSGDTEKVLAMIVYAPNLLSFTNRNGLTPLMDAVISKQYEVMRLLLLHGANTGQRDRDGWTAYSWATFIQDKEAQKILSKASRYVTVSNSDDISGAAFASMAI